uniref:Uncharacterized protein n=1 Tax=Meloidogyne enterolobii TaxID=390850 RepID=A0A6V7TT49_MELEN|nr:unnamed protein product [Meloidogyne enterolobii]
MRLLFLGVFALLIAKGLQKDSGLLEHPSKVLPGTRIYFWNQMVKMDAQKELYQPKFQLPLPRVYDGVHNSRKYTRDTGTEEEFKRVLEWEEKFFKAFIGEEKYKEYVKLSEDKDKDDQLVKFVKPYARKLKEKLPGEKNFADILKEAEANASKILKYIFFEGEKDKSEKDVKDELPKLIKENSEKVEENTASVEFINKVETAVKDASDGIKNVLGIKQSNFSKGDVIKYLKELYKIAYEMKMKPGKPVKRPCYITVGKVCIIDVSEIHETYNPEWVTGCHLLKGYLLTTHWIKPDYENVKKYAPLWHTDNKEDFLVHHDKDNHEKRIINRCSFFGKYQLDERGFPLNPVARTGFTGRGELYQWGQVQELEQFYTYITKLLMNLNFLPL